MDTNSPPSEFSYLGSCFLRDDARWGMNNFQEWATQAIIMTHFSPAKIELLKVYLDQILSSPDDLYIDSMWNLMGPAMLVVVSGGGNSGGVTRRWFRTIRDLLDTVEVKSV